MTSKKKLIEVALPLDAINVASAREKSIRHGHPSTLHLWWARRPLAAARAVIFAQMVDDPSAHPDLFPTEKAQEKERQRLFRIIEELVKWENTTNEKVLQAARDEIWQSWRAACAENAGHPRARERFDRHKLPAFHDPFAGGGSLPLEAQRLGLEAYASDLNPVAVLINKAMIEIPPKFAGRAPVNPASRATLLGAPASSPAPATTNAWRSRGYLPHVDQSGVQTVTFRLFDSVPELVVRQWKSELEWIEGLPATDKLAVELRTRIAAYEDAGHGACWLGDERIAALVEQALLHFDGVRYRLIAWCIMPNHAHVVVETWDRQPLAGTVHSWKSYTAHEANKLLGRTGEFWFREYYDRFIRNPEHLANAIEYVEANPVKAGLVKEKEAWRWSSARRRAEGRMPWVDAGGTPALPGIWRGAAGLAEDVRYYGKWMRDEAEKRIGHLYPKIEVTPEMVAERPDLRPYLGQKLTVIAWLWARTVKSPNPAFADVEVPLASTFMLSTKAGKEAYVKPVIDPGSAGVPPAQPTRALSVVAGSGRRDAGAPRYWFTVRVGKPADVEAAKNGTKLARGANFQCVMSGAPISPQYIYAEANEGRMGARMMAIVAEGRGGRLYLAPTPEMEAVAQTAQPTWKPEVEMPENPRWFSPPLYGLKAYGDLFTPRQLVALTTFSDLVGEAMERVRRDAVAAGMADDGVALRDGGVGARGYAEAVGVYLSLAIGRSADFWCSIATWSPQPKNELVSHAFTRQAIPMTWDFAEASPFSESGGNFLQNLSFVGKSIDRFPAGIMGAALQASAPAQRLCDGRVVSTDPPYYDNIGYADLSDFFYVWLRRSVKSVFPDLFATLAVPKAEELVATPYRHGSKQQAEAFFLDGMTHAMQQLAVQAHPAFPVTIYYAFKQSESEGEAGIANTGWETFLDAVIRAGFGITGTWPIRTERGARSISIGTNALASSIVLVCRPRPADAPTATRREFVAALQAELPAALAHLQRGNIAPVDLAQAAIGPGMAVYTRYSRVLDAAGKPLTVREALALINQTLDEALAEQEGDFDADTRWAVAWFEHAGFAEGEYGVAETLSTAKNTSVQGMVEAGFIVSRGGKVRLLRPAELPADWDPATDPRLTVWEIVHHLVRTLESGGEVGAAAVVAALGERADVARELAYRLYTACERKKRAAEALSYNGLVQSWPEIARLAQEAGRPRAGQAALFGEGGT